MAKRLRDVDSTARLQRLEALAWASYAGLFMGGGGGAAFGMLMGWNPILTAVAGVIIVTGGAYGFAMFMANSAAGVAQTIYYPSGSTTPPIAEYSHAQSLAVRGKYEEAAEAYEIACLEGEGDPEPYFRLGRLYRDHLERYDDAVEWFRRARTDAQLTAGQELVALQEIIELYTRKLHTPRKAIPELVQLCDRFPGTPAAEAAEQELGEMREMLAREHDGLETFTEQFLKRRRRESS